MHTDRNARPTFPGNTDKARDAYANLMAASDRGASEQTLDRLRMLWQMQQLADAGIVAGFHKSGSRWIVNAPGTIGERAYPNVRAMEAFVHGAFAGLGW